MKRRDFIALGVGVLVACRFDPLWAWQAAGDHSQRAPGYPTDFTAYFHVDPDGRVTCFVGKVEMGQGNMTALSQIAADELNVPIESVEMVMGDTDRCPWDLGTFGSMSVAVFGPVLRQAAADAAKALGRKRGASTTETRSQANVGECVPRRDAVAKVTGRAVYAGDVRLPGMLYARILRPPSHGGSAAVLDTSMAASRPGTIIVRDGDLVAVLHEHPDEADAAFRTLATTVRPSDSDLDDRSIYEHLVAAAPDGHVVASVGESGRRGAESTFAQTYLNAYVAHAAMETHTALAAVSDDKVTVWASTQAPFLLKTDVAAALKVPPARVRVITPYVGGAFGGKTAGRQAIEAARLARATGRPVQVCWNRAEEFFLDTFRPAAVISIASSLGEDGRIASWSADVFAAGDGGAGPFYSIPNQRVVTYGGWQVPAPGHHPFGVGAWRAPAFCSNAFARERHVDTMAAAIGVDPVEFRLRNLNDMRMARVIAQGARAFGWTSSALPRGQGLGMACGTYANTYVATFVEVQVDAATGEVRVSRVTCAQDMGQVVNPEGATAQVEGAVTMGLGTALCEEIHFQRGEIAERNFDQYEIPRFSSLPPIEVVLVDAPDLPPSAGGEPAVMCIAPAVGNAIYAAVGANLLALPMTPERIRAALRDAEPVQAAL